MKTLLDLFNAGLTSIPTVGIWESEQFDFTDYKTNEQIADHYQSWADGDNISLSEENIALLIEAFKHYTKEAEENFIVNDSSFYAKFGSKMDLIELQFK